MPPSRPPECLDCAWLELLVDFDGGANYFCRKLGETVSGPLLGKRACGLYADWGGLIRLRGSA